MTRLLLCWYSPRVRLVGSLALGLALLAMGCVRPVVAAHRVPVPAVATAGNERSTVRAWSVSSVPSPLLASRLEAVSQAFRERGAHLAPEPWVMFLPMEHSASLEVRVDRAGCVGIVALGPPAMQNLDLEVYLAVGNRIAQDLRPDAHPYVRTCPNAGDVLHVLPRVAAGPAGEVGVLVMNDAPLVAPELDRVLAVRSTGSFAGPRGSRVDIGLEEVRWDADSAIAHQVSHFTALGYRTVGAAMHGELEQTQESEHEIRLERGTCYAITAVAGANATDLDLRLIGPSNQLLDRDDTDDARPMLRVCPTVTGAHSLIVRMENGDGGWAAQVLAIEPAVNLPADIEGNLRAASLEAAGDARRRGMTAFGGAVRAFSGNGPLITARSVQAGRCYVFSVAVEPSQMPAVELSLQDERGSVLASDVSNRSGARVTHCATRAQRVRLLVRAGARGEYVLQSFEGRAP